MFSELSETTTWLFARLGSAGGTAAAAALTATVAAIASARLMAPSAAADRAW